MSAAPLFPGEFFAALGWALFHFLWQGALVAAVLAAFQVALARRSPALRYVVACGALALMLVLPVATAWSLARRGAPGAVPSPATLAAPDSMAPTVPAAAHAGEAFLPQSLESRLEALRPAALLLWFAGVLLFSLRFLGGFQAANRMKRRGTRPAPSEWQAKLADLAGRLSVTRPVRLLESAIVKVPTAIGALRPAILIPASVFTGLPARGIEALLAHELAHVKRHDYLVNLLQALVETLLFYHPAVWWVSARVRVEREECCDDLAIAATGDARSYARALVRLEEMRGRAPALAVAAAGGNLWNRVVRLLRERPASSDRPSSWIAGALALALLAVLGAAASVDPRSAEPAEAASSSPAEAPDSPAPDATVVAEGDGPSAEDADSDADADPEEGDAEEDSDDDEKTTARGGADWELTEDERDAFANHGVTPEFVRAVAALGYERANPDTILALRIHGVNPADIAEMNRIFGKRPLDEHVAFKIHGVTPEAVRRMSELGVGKVSPDEALAFKIHGVDPEFVEKFRAAGLDQLDADELVAARIHGVRPEDPEAWKRLGFPRPSLEELVAARIHGVDPEFAAEIRSAGLAGTSLEDLVSFRIHGVTGEFLREMKALGLELSGDEATGFRIHGVTSDFVREIQSLGYSNADPDDLVSLRIHGISAADVREENARAGQRLPLDEIIDNRNFGKDDDDDE